MDLKALQREAHAIAKDHGWWDEERTFGDLIALVHSELSEALEAYRKHGFRDWRSHTYSDGFVDEYPQGEKPEGVAYELADVVIRVADMYEHYGVDGGVIDRHLANLRVVMSDPPLDKTFGERITVLHNWVSHAGQIDYDQGQWSAYLGAVVFQVERMAAHYGIDLDAAIEAKMEHNRTRSYRHGGKTL